MNPNLTPDSFIHFLAAMAPFQLLGLVESRQILAAGHSDLYYQTTSLSTPSKAGGIRYFNVVGFCSNILFFHKKLDL